MKTQTPKSIFVFKKGDVITRLQPSPGRESIFGQFSGDNSYIGDKLIFVGVANGNAYFQLTGIQKKIFGDKLIDLPLVHFQEGWDYWIDPNSLLLEDSEEMPDITIEALQREYDKAISEENYEYAAKLKPSLDKQKPSKKKK
jgi:hypothetical protein